MAFQFAPPPLTTPIIDRDKAGKLTGLMTLQFSNWLRAAVLTPITQSSRTLTTVSLTDQHASIGATAINTTTLSAGLYRAWWYARVTTAAGVSSSLTVTLGWTESSIALTYAGVAMTGNTTATTQSDGGVVRIDGATNVTYATTYASNAAGAMQYRLDVVLEALSI